MRRVSRIERVIVKRQKNGLNGVRRQTDIKAGVQIDR